MGKNIGYFPKGDKNQHKMMATGEGLRKANTKDLDPSGWGEGQKATEGRTNIKSGTSTGSGAGKSVPKSTFTPA
jgi:hypothetical protein